LTIASAVSLFSATGRAQQVAPSERAQAASAPAVSTTSSPATSAQPASPGQPSTFVPPPPGQDDEKSTNVIEKPGKAYYFLGARYRGTIIPKFLMNIFVDGGKTLYSNTIGAELDIRKDGFSFIPSITYTEYGTGGPVMFLEKSKPDTANNWSVVDSSLKGIYLNADLLWSTKVHENLDIEYGVGVGLGAIFGSLGTNWVYEKAGGPYSADNGKQYAPCVTEADDPSSTKACQKSSHSNASVAKVNGYEEPSWVNGGSKPNVFINLAVPQFGLRFKPLKEMVARLTVGFSITGFFFGLSADYGLEKALNKKTQ